MKERLRQIYDDLSSGRLTQQEALERIRAIKAQERDGAGAFAAHPVWEDAPIDTAAASVRRYAEHHVLLCDVPNIGSLLADSECVSLPSAEGQTIAQRYTDAAAACFERVQAILQRKPQAGVLVQIVVAEREENVVLAGLSGLLKTAALENPHFAGQLVVVAGDTTAEELARRIEEEKRGAADAVVRYEGGVRQVLRWKEIESTGERSPVAFKDGGVYLITGGLGALGTLFANEILHRAPQAKVVLTGRSAWSDAVQARVDALGAHGGRLSYRQVALGDLADVERLIAAILGEHGRLDGILHAAGSIADNFLIKKSGAELRTVLEPKVAGAVHLDHATRDVELDFFVLFSSVAGAMGNVGQADYAMANGFLDRFAAYRNRLVGAKQRHGRTRSINWPLWQAGGMGLDEPTRELLQRNTGMQPMRTATGLDAFHRSLSMPHDQILVAEGDLALMRSVLLTGRLLPAEPEQRVAAQPVDAGNLVEKTEEYLRRECSEVLQLPVQRIDPQAALEKYGIDSILAMKLTSHLEKTFGTLPKTLFFEYQSIRELTKYFVESHADRLAALFPAVAEAPALETKRPAIETDRPPIRRGRQRSAPAAAKRDERDPIAIIGLSGRYPEAVDIEAYWRNLRDGKDCIVEVPKERWNWRDYFSEDRTESGRHYSKWGGFIAGVDEFDPLFFNISPKEAKFLDPQERLFLQQAWMALEDAGYTRAALQVPSEGDLPAQVGVYAGVMYSEYQLFGAESSLRGKPLGIAASPASIANRVSYALNLHGPSLTLDTMCSSSLSAIHVACEDLRHGRTNLAIAGGVNVSIHPNKYLLLSAGQFISSDGHCQSFGEGGDGYIPGEGVGVVILKRLSEAERDGDHIYAIIRGSALNHGGKTNGFTVPNPSAQASVITRALKDARTDARHITYLEAHGTGTKLGDPIEIAALGKAFQKNTQDTGFCRIGSAKSNIGHCESAAGIAGLTKVLLQMQHRQIVPSLHSAQLNPHIDFDKSPFVVNQTLTPWEQPVVDGRTLPRIAGISSFGAGGSNAHLIVEEYQSPVRQPMAAANVAIVLSARTPEQLQQKARELREFVGERQAELDLVATAYTLQVGREAMDERLAFVVKSAEELIEKLDAHLAGRVNVEDAYSGQVKRNKDALSVFSTDADLQQTVDRWMAEGRLAKLLDLWVKGLELDWSKLYGEVRPQRVSLPAYPFARERYWIDVVPQEPAVETAPATAVLHPLLHTNTSDLQQQSYRSTFRPNDPHLDAEQTLPATAYFEMARAAVRHAARVGSETSIELRDVVCAQPVVVAAETNVDIALLAHERGNIEFEIYSANGGEEIVHCQGRAVIGGPEETIRVDSVEVRPLPAPEVAPVLERKEIAFQTSAPAVPAATGRKRPAIALAAPGAAPAGGTRQPSARRQSVTLAAAAATATSPVRLYDGGNGVFSIEIAASRAKDAISHFLRALERVQQETSVKVLTLSGIEHCFLSGGREEANDAVERQLHRAIVSFPYPVVAVLQGDVVGAGFLAAAVCDFVVCSDDAQYGYTDAEQELYPTTAEAALFAARFGSVRAHDLLYVAPLATGKELRAKGWTCPILPWSDVESHAYELAATLSSKSQTALRLLKQHLSRRVAALAGDLERIDEPRPVLGTASHVEMMTSAELLESTSNDANAIVLVLEETIADNAAAELQRRIVESPVAVVAALKGDARGNSLRIAQLCDACVYSETGTYSFAGLVHAAPVFARRLGDAAARELLLTGGDVRGTELRERIGAIAVAEADRVVGVATDIARLLAKCTRTTRQTVAALEVADAAEVSSVPSTISLQSSVVTATALPDGVVVVRMEDRDAKNLFSEALVEGLHEAFAHIERTPGYKAVVLTGYDSYFASGGTKETLLAIQAGRVKFTDRKVFQLPLDCSLPVVAAMQGHGIGAGWTLGMFADVALLSEESRYASPYMEYGFTPGAGATWILGRTLGEDVARESLFTARQYTGRELKDRGVRLPVVRRADVEAAAIAVAKQIARGSREELITLKRWFRAQSQEALEETYRLELAMHDATFVGQSATLAQIEEKFQLEAEPGAPSQPQPQAAAIDAGDVLASVTATLRTLLANELQMRESDVDENAQFVDLGLDSIGGVSWIRKINEKYRTSVEATKIYNFPTLAQLSQHVKEEAEQRGTLLQPQSQPQPKAIAAPQPAPISSPRAVRSAEKLTSRRGKSASRFAGTRGARSLEPIAVVGMAGQFPKAKNVEQFWDNIAEGKNCISEVPADRWDLGTYYQPGEPAVGKTNSRWVGALEEFDRFDPLFFNISPTEAESMDPQQRLFLQACWHSIENAGYPARVLSGSKCGVFVGCAAGDYHQLSQDHDLSAQGFTGNAMSILAARISYFLNLQGPCISIDTACSSSLVAIAQACDSLLSGESDVALAGGVYVMAGPQMHIKTAQAAMLSAEGKCFTFDQRADGFVPGEGVGVVVLKRLADAQRDGDIIHGVIQGWGINQDGKTNGITAPNPESQTRLQQEVYDKYEIDPASIQLIEAHGTGTKLGDPIEVEGLKNAFQKYTRATEYCALGSVKSNIGHCLTAAGIAGVLKLLLALKHRQLPPTINFERLNEHIDLKDSPFYVNTRLQPWEAGSQRRLAAISSFGFSGTNAHLVIGEHQQAEEVRPAAAAPQIVPLSARTAAQLKQRAADLLELLRKDGRSIDLGDVAYTLQTGRDAMDERTGFVVSSVEELVAKLQAYVDSGAATAGGAKRGKAALGLIGQDDELRKTVVEKYLAEKKLAKLLELWVNGLELDWSRLHGDAKPKRIALPVYPFAKDRYWIDAAATKQTTAAVLHPLLHANTSDLDEQRYSATFAGNEFFLVDHQVTADGGAGRKVLPAVAYLEMARAAVERALPGRPAAMELRNVVWAQPIVVDEQTTVNVAVAAAGDGQVDFEIYSSDADDDVVHCQGRAVLAERPALAKVELEQVAREMQAGRIDADAVYAAWTRMGLLYGPSFRAITAVHRGNGQLLAEIRLPEAALRTSSDYVLHPALTDSALQACVGLLDFSSERANEPRLPFALETLRVVGPCTATMRAWVRYAPGSRAEDTVVKLDIDLCDERGNVCAQFRGLSSRPTSKVASLRRADVLLAAPVWQASDAAPQRVEPKEQHVVLCDLPHIDAGALQSLLPQTRCTALHAGRYNEQARACFDVVQEILRGKPDALVLVQIVATSSELAGLSALLDTASLENPHFAGQVILVPSDTTAEQLAAALDAERSRADRQVRYDSGVRQVVRWQEVPAADDAPSAFRNDGVYLITGGLGAIGRIFTNEILEKTSAARVILTGRSAGVAAQRDRVTYRQVDLADAAQVRQLVAGIVSEHGRLNGILHCAGFTADNFILKKSGHEFDEVLTPKVTGTVNLDEATRDLELDWFALFSSVAGAMGNVGQADYAAANAYMDRFAAHRNSLVATKQRHGRTHSIGWPLWEDGGMTIDVASREALQRATGIRPMQTPTGIAIFHRALALPHDQLLVGVGDLAQMRRALLDGRAAVVAEAPAASLPADANDLAEKTQEHLRKTFAALLKLPAAEIDPHAALEKYGIDSILSMKLTNELEKTFGSLSKTLLFEYQTIGELARYFVQSHSAKLATLFATPAEVRPSVPAVVETKPVASRRTRRARSTIAASAPEVDPIAIIGLSGRYPEAVDIEAYWQNLRDGKDCIVEVPKERWDWREYFSDDRTESGRHFSKWGGFIQGVDEFDPLFFNISPKEAKFIDPQERLFLQHAWMAVEDAGYTRASLQMPSAHDLGGQVGVYVGVMYTEYQLFGAEATARGQRLGVAGSAASIANRVSYALNLHGPSITLDTMCSSSLTAIHIACQDLKLGRTSLAIAGGVNVTIHPNKYLVLSAGQFISSDGHCQSFGEGGDGYIPGEGVGVVVLKRLSEAKRDGDHIYGIIRGSALNHGGKTNGYTVPNPQAQADAISRALADARTDARHISYIEAHGTGTKLGDPIEIAALGKAFQQYTGDTGFCSIGSAKSNIGHCESAAGIAGLTKVLLQLEHRQIVPSLHSAQLNPFIDFASTPFTVNQALRPWEQPVVDGRALPRIAGISSFGAGGANAHVVVEEYEAPVRQPLAAGDVVILLSARTAAQLRQKASDLLQFVRTRIGAIDLAAVAWTLQVGREAMEERLGFLVSSAEQLAEKLQAFVDDAETDGIHLGRVKRSDDGLSLFSTDSDFQQTIEKWIAARKLPKLVELWVKGVELDWSRLYGEAKPPRVSLPAYPFAKDRYWIDTTAVPVAAKPLAAAEAIHPLLHRNTSNLTEQRYTSTLTGELHAGAYLEMARAAVENALPERPVSAVLELRDVVWAQPAATGEREIHVALFASDEDEVEFEIYSDVDVLHCRGRAVLHRDSAALDLRQLERNNETRLNAAEENASGYVLVPSLIDQALQGRTAVALEWLRILAPCTSSMVAWSRTGVETLDVDLCDEQGNVCVQMRGLRSERAAQPLVVKTAEAHVPVAPQKLVIAARPAEPVAVPAPVIPAFVERKKPARISLAAPSAFGATAKAPTERPAIALASAAAPRHETHGDGVVALRVESAGELLQSLEQLKQEPSLKVLTLSGLERCAAIDRKAFEAIIAFPYPVIAILQSDAVGAAFLAAALCDFIVCHEEASYGYPRPSAAEAKVFAERFGAVRARDLLVRPAALTGRQLREKGFAHADAQTLAASLAAKSREALRLLKENQTRRLVDLVRALEPSEELVHATGEVLVAKFADVADLAAVGYKAIVLVADDPRHIVPDDAVADVRRLAAESNVPVVAALSEDARGNAFFAAQLCDAVVYSSTGVYSAAGVAPSAANVVAHRFGRELAAELLLTGAEVSGAELHGEERDRVVPAAIELAELLANVPRATRAFWKAPAATAHEAEPEAETRETLPTEPTAIPLRSHVVSATAHPDGVVVVKMEDRDSKNLFSEAFIDGLSEAFEHIARTPGYKAVVLTGYDHYFASGGTKESLLAIQSGKAKFTDVKVFQLPFDCKLPVIAAMQGHGIGAGWTLGLFADLVLLGDESRYVSPYMEYGFTPGAGATWVLAEKLGVDVARESLFTAQPLTGRELKQRGVRLPVLPRADVEAAAIALARQIARGPRSRAIAIKQQLTAPLHGVLEETYRLELAMHDQTFVGHSATLAQIEEKFHAETVPVAPVQPRIEIAKPAESGDALPSVTATLRTLLAAELQMQESDVDEHAQFVDLGLDSIGGVSWIRKINEKYRTSIEATKIYNYPTLAQLSRYVKDEAERQGTLPSVAAPAEVKAPQPAPVPAPPRVIEKRIARRRRTDSRVVAEAPATTPSHAIAVIGMAGQFPKAKNLGEFWDNIAQGRNCVTEVPADRWDIDAYYHPGDVVAGKTNSRWVGALEEFDRFDPLFFNISPTEAESMDPQQRVFLQACWHSIEDAGYDARRLSGTKCGVFAGCAAGDYLQLSRKHQLSAQGFTGGAPSILAARISYFLNLQGPCISIDTACSSSLVSIAYACDSLNSGASDLALAGGVCVMAGPEMHIKTAQAGMLSPDGRCFTFDQRANGIVPGEGVGVVVLKRLADAERDGDTIYGVIQGWGVNQDGKTNGITAPNPESQTRLEQEVYERFRIDPAEIQLVEAHGTGTKLGDPIEVEGLKASFRKYTQDRAYCALGSVKSNIGHTLTAAGVAGVLKLLLALKHRQLPPTINFDRLNEHIDLGDSPFFVNTELKPWSVSSDRRRQAAMSAFGFSGTNAHVVVGEYQPPVAARPVVSAAPMTRTAVPLSARTPEQLRSKAGDLLELIRRDGQSLDLADVAFTLQTGRAAMDERLAFVVSSLDELAAKLQAFLDGQQRIDDVYQGQVKRNKEAVSLFAEDADLQQAIDKWIASRKFSKLLDLWVKGLELDWNKVYGDARPRRVSLPLYPFAKERYWIEATQRPRPRAGAWTRVRSRRDAQTVQLIATPLWQASDAGATNAEPAEQHVILCDVSNVDAAALESLLPNARCTPVQADYTDAAVVVFERLQAILRAKPQGTVLVQVVATAEVFAGLSGLLKTAALENTNLIGQCILVPESTTAEDLAAKLAAERTRALDSLVRYDAAGRQVLQWQRIDAEAQTPVAFRDGGVYLITGGTGALGRLFAREIVERTRDARVILTGRSATPAAALESERLSYRHLDLGDPAAVEQFVASILEEHGRLDGILHSAGATSDNVIVKKTPAELRGVLAPKVTGTLNLDRATRDVALDFFVLFSSIASVMGNVGQADYAAANGFLDHFAVERNRKVAAGERHGRTRSIDWGLWRDGGMHVDAATLEMVRQATGLQPLRTATGLQAFHHSLALPYDRTLVVEGVSPKIDTLLDGPQAIETYTVSAAPAISIDQLQQQLKGLVASVLRIDAATMDADQPFNELGLDSFLGAELIVAINKKFGTELSHARLFDHPTVAELAQFLSGELPKAPAQMIVPAVRRTAPQPKVAKRKRLGRPVRRQAQVDDRIAIVGMSGRYPQADTLGQYWENLVEGRNAITEVPASRWDVNRYYDPERGKKDRTYSKWLGAIEDFDCFDPLFFRISPQEAEQIDPQHRLFLQESYRAFEDAGYSAATLSNRKCGVYVGIATSEYVSLLSRNRVWSASVTSNSSAIAAARIAYYLNLKGPAIAVDTACSSSLVAMHLASRALLNGEIDMALAGGVTLWMAPESYVAMSQAGMFSSTGQCKTFDDSADGIVNGDGVGAVVLKRLSDAERDGDFIYGVILGSAINQDGKTNGITAPSVNSQIELERGLYATHGIDPETISYVETHGTGTRLGDPIELEALATVFQERTSKKNFCALGSVKSNIGHTTAAAGVAGLQKVLLSMRHRTLVPSLNVTRENGRFDFANSPFYISRETRPWDVAPGSLRRAAVSSFGFSGTNAHLVIEEYPMAVPAPIADRGAVVVPLSARTAEQLRQRAADLLDYLAMAPQPIDLAALAYTLQVGREAMEERLGLIVSSLDDLASKLCAYVHGEKSIDGLHRGRVEPGSDGMTIIGRDDDMQEAIEKWIARRKLASLLDLWIRGLNFDWKRLYGEETPRRIPLPTYPFARERYWIEEVAPFHPHLATIDTQLQSIEDVIDSIDDDAIDTDQAVRALKALV